MSRQKSARRLDGIEMLTVHVEGDGCAFAGGNSQVGGHAAVVPPSVTVDGRDRQVAPCGHPLPVWKHLLMMDGGEMMDSRQIYHTDENTESVKTHIEGLPR